MVGALDRVYGTRDVVKEIAKEDNYDSGTAPSEETASTTSVALRQASDTSVHDGGASAARVVGGISCTAARAARTSGSLESVTSL